MTPEGADALSADLEHNKVSGPASQSRYFQFAIFRAVDNTNFRSPVTISCTECSYFFENSPWK
jgi:hypothetical protein